MSKKELPTTIRGMHMFKPIEPGIYRMRGDRVEFEHPLPVPPEDKDALIAQLRASLGELMAKNRARVAKHREKKRAKP